MNITIPNKSMAPIFKTLGATYVLEVSPHNRFRCYECGEAVRKGTTHLSMIVHFFQADKVKRFCCKCAPQQVVQMQINLREFERRLAAIAG